jgi:hypothetical protein
MSVTHVLLSSTFLAAFLAAGVNAWVILRASKERERERLRTTLAEAFRAYSDYKEFPYAIRRRSEENPASERLRLSEELREIQSRISYYRTWLLAESSEIGEAYGELIQKVRKVAGESMQRAWQEPPCTSDAEMNIGPEKVNLSELKSSEDAFSNAIKDRIRVRD